MIVALSACGAGANNLPASTGAYQLTSGAGGAGAVASAAEGVQVTFTGGHATDPRDGGRPVVLIAAALGVPTEVFREAFSHVSPAAAGHEPDPAQVRANKAALLKVLAPYGVTNEALDRVSNYYRFNGRAGETWPQTPATATAILTNGVVTELIITHPGAGYSSAPEVVLPGGATAAVSVAFGTDIASNGSLTSLALTK
jgi:hypothetical protein